MANLTALMIAHRAKANSNVASTGLWNSGAPMTLYASEQIHMSIPKAADILGWGATGATGGMRRSFSHEREVVTRA